MGYEDKIIGISQKAYGLCIIAMGIQQLVYGDIDPNFLPFAFSKDPHIIYQLLTYPWGIAFTLSGVAILINKKAFEVSLVSAWIFLALCLFIYVPYLAFFSGVCNVFIQWAPAFETLAFTGASLIVAESFRNEENGSTSLTRTLGKLIPFGGAFFSAMLIAFGIDHFLYMKGVASMVPTWIPFPYFWTYLTGTALIGAGIAITFKIKLRLVASLLASMIFFWFIFLHIPRALHEPVANRGLELTRVFVTFGFAGISFLLAFARK